MADERDDTIEPVGQPQRLHATAAASRREFQLSQASNRMKIALVVAFFTVIVVCIIASSAAVTNALNNERRNGDAITIARGIMKNTPCIDGRNDLAYKIRLLHNDKLSEVDLDAGWGASHTDIPRLKEGQVGAQFWTITTPCDSFEKDAARQTLDQMDLIKRFVTKYADSFKLATSLTELFDVFRTGKISSLLGISGGHNIDDSLANLRLFYELGVRYLSLTYDCNTPWADSHNQEPVNNGLSEAGKNVVREMNRLGMMVDLSYSSVETMLDALDTSEAPVMFSHSAAKAKVTNSSRNIPDEVLNKLKSNNGIVMVSFDGRDVSTSPGKATLKDVADHIVYLKSKVGINSVGVGAGYDSPGFNAPEGLEDASRYPYLIAELINRGWTDEEIEKLIGLNLSRVLKEVEIVRDNNIEKEPIEDNSLGEKDFLVCRTMWKE